MKVDMTYWCESCARKNNCYTIRSRPKCFTPITSNDRTADRKTEPKICDTCRYYNSNIPCGSTPSACKEADKFAKEFVDGLKKLKQTVPTISKMEQVEDEPQTDCGDFADRLAYERGVKHAWEVAQKVFDSTVTFYEAEDVAKQIDKDINVRSKDEPHIVGKHADVIIIDEPQTERGNDAE